LPGAGLGGVPGPAVLATAAGAVLVWSGVRGVSVTGALRSLISGKAPPAASSAEAIAAPAAGSAGASIAGDSAAGSAVSADAVKYIGHAYSYGGAPGPDGAAPWDCSSFVSFVLGHDLGMAIPGGSWASVTSNGASHGPTTLSYLAWSGATTVGHTAAVAQAGDLCVWQTHIGICTGAGQMVSAEDEQLGTGLSNIAIPGEMLFVRRLAA
jgi:cell wall-associated NlpC family hydrolase